MSDRPRVTVAGGGLAGISAALELAKRGADVKLYEQKSMLGGNLASREQADGRLLDIYPHMYLPWYRNFWRMIEAAGVDREKDFTRFSAVRQMRRAPTPRFATLSGGYTPRRVVENLFSGITSPANMFLFGYAMVDLLAERRQPTVLLANMTLSGFLSARRAYMTTTVIEIFEAFITSVWAIPAYLVSAEDCRTYLGYSLAEPEAVSWLARAPAATAVIAPLEAALAQAGVEVECGVEVSDVTRRGARAEELSLRRTRLDPATGASVAVEGASWTEELDELVLALPPKALSALVRGGPAGERLVDADYNLAQLARLSTQQVPIVYLYFKGTLEQIPAEPVGLTDSRLLLAFTDVSQAWPAVPECSGRTVLAVSCSEPEGLVGRDDRENGFQIIEELAEYLRFQPGAAWGEAPYIDWGCTRYFANDDTQLSLNAIGTDPWRPSATSSGLANVVFAGDLCHQEIGLTTIESAVASGLEAANAIIARRDLGSPLDVLLPRTLPGLYYVLLRAALLPSALAMKQLAEGLGDLEGATPQSEDRDSLLRYLLTPGLAPRYRRDS
jgi:flavin-dependent amine oxidoreductase